MMPMNELASLRDLSLSPATGVAGRLIVFLHGYGADGADLLSLGRSIAPGMPDCAFVSPDAPFPCEAGFGRQWFGLRDWSQAGMRKGVADALPLLSAYLSQQRDKWKVAARDTYLIGFSQGTMMALSAALSAAEPCGGVIGYSGTYVEASPVASWPPVLLVHGTADTVVPFAALGDSEQRLRAGGIDVATLAIPGLGHGVDPQGIQAGLEFLDKHRRS
jgi:phospholipase/carboxylesterase